MQSRLAIVLMSVAGTAALFGIGFVLGLGVMSTPKPEQHKEHGDGRERRAEGPIVARAELLLNRVAQQHRF